MCNCRTTIKVEDPQAHKNELNELNKRARFYFVLVNDNSVILERASLILGTPKEIKEEKVFLIDEIRRITK